MNIVLCEEVPPVLDCTLSIVLCEVVPPVLDCTITIDICEVVPYEATVTNVFGYMEPCIGGTIDDHMGASVMLNSAVSVDTSFNVDVTYVYPPMFCSSGGSTYTQSFTVEILEGQTSSNFNACYSGAYFQGGANICSACITYCSNPAVDLSTLGC